MGEHVTSYGKSHELPGQVNNYIVKNYKLIRKHHFTFLITCNNHLLSMTITKNSF